VATHCARVLPRDCINEKWEPRREDRHAESDRDEARVFGLTHGLPSVRRGRRRRNAGRQWNPLGRKSHLSTRPPGSYPTTRTLTSERED
jgi:hypothetical protein